jgi:Rrf2 family protein
MGIIIKNYQVAVIKMKISTKGRYALRLMLDLAINHTGEYISIKSIASRQDISEKYLEQIITQLNRAGYVRSVRGAQGGLFWPRILRNTRWE